MLYGYNVAQWQSGPSLISKSVSVHNANTEQKDHDTCDVWQIISLHLLYATHYPLQLLLERHV